MADPADPGLAELAQLLRATFPDPNTVLDLERIQAFLVEPPTNPGRHFRVLVAEDGEAVVGGTIFSFVPATNCGFSEYLAVHKQLHGQGIGRRLFDARRANLDALARELSQPACRGVFIEVDNPRRTPADLVARERATAIDPLTRLAVFGHLGFLRVDVDYVQPPLGPGKQWVTYLDLLFAPWDEHTSQDRHLPAGLVSDTLCPIWKGWTTAAGAADCELLRHVVGESPLALVPVED